MGLSKQFSMREKVLLVIMAVVLLCGLYFWCVHKPLLAEMERIRIEQVDADDELTLVTAKAKQLQEMRAALEEIHKTAAWAQQTPAYDNLQGVISLLNGVMADASTYQLSFQPVAMPEEGNVVRRVIDVTFTAPGYAQASRVVQRLHDGPYRCHIGTISFAPVLPEAAPAGYTSTLSAGGVTVTLSITYFENRK